LTGSTVAASAEKTAKNGTKSATANAAEITVFSNLFISTLPVMKMIV